MNITHNTNSGQEWNILENAVSLFKNEQYEQANLKFEDVLKINPNNPHALHGIAAIAVENKNFYRAEKFCEKALKYEKNVGDFYYTQGLIFFEKKRLEDAIISFQTAIKLTPNHLLSLLRLGDICRNQGAIYRRVDMLNAAINFYNRALAIRAEVETYQNMGYIFRLLGQYDNAIMVSEACLKKHPDSAEGIANLAFLYDFSQRYEEALVLYDRVIKIDPKNGKYFANKAGVLKNMGYLEEAIKTLKIAIELNPEDANSHHSLLLTMVYTASIPPEELASASKNFGSIIADPLYKKQNYKNGRDPDKKLRIGYVSPDFRDHAVSYFLSPIYFANKEHFEIFVYSKNIKDDEVTEYIRGYVDKWNNIQYLSDEDAADLILKDKIDILVDLAGHTANNGLLIFAKKPAPIQVTWLGHPATTGMRAMDYRITDFYAEPVGMTEHLNTETLWRLPNIFCAFTPPKNGPNVVDRSPFEDNGYITFGCFNNFTKVTDPVLKIWAKILKSIPDAHLMLEIPGLENKKIKEEVTKRLTSMGIPMDRTDLRARSKDNQYVLYNKIDIALDPFPCNGGTTSMDTLWMGVPFITLAGNHFSARMGVTILSNAGLSELIARTEDEYVSLVVNLAENKDKLRALRHNLRERVMQSPLMDQKAFANDMETAFRKMWQTWLQTEK